MTDQPTSSDPTNDETGDRDWPTSDAHRLDPEHLPTPFTAAEIRVATPSGRTIETSRFSHAEDGSPLVARARIIFSRCNRKGARMRTIAIDEDGGEIEVVSEAKVTWHELQAHASFPVAEATRVRDRIRTPLGPLDCLRYTVVPPGEDGDRRVFWFSARHPGMPVRYGVERRGRFVDIITITARR